MNAQQRKILAKAALERFERAIRIDAQYRRPTEQEEKASRVEVRDARQDLEHFLDCAVHKKYLAYVSHKRPSIGALLPWEYVTSEHPVAWLEKKRKVELADIANGGITVRHWCDCYIVNFFEISEDLELSPIVTKGRS